MLASLGGLVVVLAVSLLVGLATGSWLMWRESQEKEAVYQRERELRDLAERRAEQARSALDEVARTTRRGPARLGETASRRSWTRCQGIREKPAGIRIWPDSVSGVPRG